MPGNHLFTALFKVAADRRPRVAGLDEMTPGAAQRGPALRIAEQRHHGVGKRPRFISARVVDAGPDAEPFGADRGRDHRSRHGQRLEDLQPRAAAGAQRHDVDGALGDRWANVADRPGYGDAADPRRGVA